ncbi:ATP-dependent RNA helicase DDX51 [Lingula anatina]|uniref:ATP-dependent RNA helicase n=2 Tax=Lingula anatina TaxID=7574 RepID=A0A2R2MRE2_LINAN|nr:ATP-dependent RNA helicase DDX51 [Lingula anatina]|eukprot:XP_023932582.1 ATP-dependent RNA helicase DDX51 [Lingula anatina]
MALFSVSRFSGDAYDTDGNKNKKAADILANIHRKAKEKRRQSCSNVHEAKEESAILKHRDLTQNVSFNINEESVKHPVDHVETKPNDLKETFLKKDESKPSAKNVKRKREKRKLKTDHDSEKDMYLDSRPTISGVVKSISQDLEGEKKRKRFAHQQQDDKEQADISDEPQVKSLKESTETGIADADDQIEGERQDFATEDQTAEGGFTVLGNFYKKKQEKVHRQLPAWLSHPTIVPIDIRYQKSDLDAVKGLDESLREKLKENNISSFFPVQASVIPAILQSVEYGMGRAGYRPSDICCSAATGSGKTLAFVLPIVQILQSRVVPQIRALAILPSRDLATQVYKVFQTYCSATQLKVGLIIGQKTLGSEQTTIVKKSHRGFQSLVDILVATPGRLVDHINLTPGFTLQHLQFLVIDEADRMMDEIKQDWLTRVETAVYEHRTKPGALNAASASRLDMPLHKLLFSATLSQNPEKLQQLNLFQPKLFTAGLKERVEIESVNLTSEKTGEEDGLARIEGGFVGKYTTPVGLSEYFIQVAAQDKPLVVLHLMHHLKFRHVLCFTNSVEATHRLFLLVKLVGGLEVREFSSSLHAIKRNRILKQFAAGKIDLLVCSDAMARGMDVDNVQYVLSYDSPPYIKTYIHRVGRTARAGKVGTAVSLCEKKEIFHFKKMIKEAGKTSVSEMKLRKSDYKALVEPYKNALAELQEILKKEKKGKR